MAAQARFRLIRRFLAPRWLTEGEGGMVGYALDLMKDAFVQRLFLGLLARFPETAPTDALAAIGRDRRVVRGINETEASYRARVLLWLDDRRVAGNPFALMKKISEYIGPGPSYRTVDARGNWYSRAADGTESVLLNQANWQWDDDTSGLRWSRFWVIIYPNGLWAEYPNDWGDTLDPGWGQRKLYTWGCTTPHDVVRTIQFLVADWKPQGTRCVNIILALDPASFDPTNPVDDPGMPNGLWERWSKNVAGVQVPARLDTARYWDGA